MQLTDEERQRRSELAKRLHAEGKFGGAGRGQGRPRKVRASEKVAEEVAKEGQAIFDRLMEITRSGSDSNSIHAAKTLLQIEEQERIIETEEDAKIEQLKRDELLALVASKLGQLTARGVVPDFAGAAVVIEDDGPARPREIPVST